MLFPGWLQSLNKHFVFDLSHLLNKIIFTYKKKSKYFFTSYNRIVAYQ